MKKFLISGIFALISLSLHAQADAKAAKILDKVLAELTGGNGIRVDFTGNENGFLLLKGEKFYLNNGNIQSWYDGKTQWSYVADTEEVNISHPTPEELKGINPYYILIGYKTDFKYTYTSSPTRNGQTRHEIILIPNHSGNKEIVRVFISENFQPLNMKIEQNGQVTNEINVTNYQKNQQLTDEMFRFNSSLYPNAEIIDLR